MKTSWVLDTQGDPLGTVTRFLTQIWQVQDLQGLILAASGTGDLRVVDETGQLGEFNPFQPIMIMNIAGRVPGILKDHPRGQFGIVLRPCELRAYREVCEREPIDPARLMTICVDCLGTFPEDEFAWRSQRKGSEGGLTGEALQFAPQGGIASYRYRAACQMCISPGAQSADINVGVLGLPVRQYMLVETDQQRSNLAQLADREASPDEINLREVMLSKLVERHTQTRERVLDGLSEVLPATVDKLLDQFETCGACQECIQACPICSLKPPAQAKSGRYDKQAVVEWLVDCSGCGMCEQACPRHMPLSIIFTHVKRSLEEARMI